MSEKKESPFSLAATLRWLEEKRQKRLMSGPRYEMPSGLTSLAARSLKSGVYVFEAAYLANEPAFFKVGYASNVAQRLAAVRVHCPFEAFCVYFFEGGAEPEERCLQAKWIDHHFRAEWFHAAPELIEQIRDGSLNALLRTARVSPVTLKDFNALKRARRAA